MKFSREIFRLLFHLYGKQGWLQKKEPELFELLEQCDTIGEQELVVSLLDRFSYLTSDKFGECLSGIAHQICVGWGLDKARTQISAVTVDADPDSSQLMLQALKAKLPAYDWQGVQMKNLFGRAISSVADYPIVVLVDEFAGTGRTIVSRIRTIKKEAAAASGRLGRNVDVKVYVALVAALSEAEDVIRAEGGEVVVQVPLKKGIDGYLVGQQRLDAVQGMHRLESMLKQNLGTRAFPSFGDGGAEALYTMENGNTPNSVFPIFWWRVGADGLPRRPILDRLDPLFQ